MVHRSAVIQVTASTFEEAIEKARLVFDQIWECTPETRPFDLVQARAEPGAKDWTVQIDAEDA